MWSKIIIFLFGSDTGKKILSSSFNKILKIVVVVLILLNMSWFINWIKSLFNRVSLKEEDNPTSNTTVTTGHLSHNYINYLAQKLYTAMMGYGTDENSINSVYKVISSYPDDIYTLFNSFGNHPYAYFGAPTFGSLQPTYNGDLRYWLKQELSYTDFLVWDNLFSSVGL